MSHIYPDPIQGPNSPVAKSFPYEPMPHCPQLVLNHVELRDYFAAAALQGLLASQREVAVTHSVYSYIIADEMLKAREVKP